MGPGTLYGVLTRLQKDELIVILNDDGRRKTYAVRKFTKVTLTVIILNIRGLLQ